MDISEYLPMFLAEGREHLQELNLAVVRIEERPDDQETVDEIFRIAHSLKGMSATMGFAGMAALTHEMEDVFELLRQRKGGLPREAIDVLLECLDALSAAVDAIDESGEEEIEPKPLITRLKGLIRDRDAEEPEVKETAEAPIDLAELADGRRVVQVSATLSDDVQIPSVRAYMVLSALAELGETLACVPSPDDVETFSGSEIDAWMVSERTDSELAAVVGAVSDVAHVEVFEAVSDAAVETGDGVVRSREGSGPHEGGRRRRSRSPAVTTARAPRPSAWTPSGSTSSCTSWASSCCTAPRSRRSPPTPTCRASRRRCRT